MAEADSESIRCIDHAGFPVALPEHLPCRKLPATTAAHELRSFLRNVSSAACNASCAAAAAADNHNSGIELRPTPGAIYAAVAGLRALLAEVDELIGALRTNAGTAHLQLGEIYAAARAAAKSDDEIAWVDVQCDRLAATIDATRDSKVHTLESQLVSVDAVVESLQNAASAACAAADDDSISNADLMSAWSVTHSRRLQKALAKASATPLAPLTSAALYFVSPPRLHSPSPSLGSIVFVRPGDVNIVGLRRVMPAVAPGAALTFYVEVAESVMLERGVDALEATKELLSLLQVDAVSVASPPRPRVAARATQKPPGDSWACPECLHRNFAQEMCELCDYGRSAVAWTCSVCTFINEAARGACELCESLPSAPTAPLAFLDEISGDALIASMSLESARARIKVSVALPARAPDRLGVGGAVARSFVVVRSITVAGAPLSVDVLAAATAPTILAPFEAVYDPNSRSPVHVSDNSGQTPCLSDRGTL